MKAWSAEPYRSYIGTFFLVFGFLAQAMFTFRFVVQWIASERAKKSVIPMSFWYFSLLGGTMLFIYALYRVDPVFIMGQGAGVIIYVRNVILRLRERRQAEAGIAPSAPSGGH
ncbi:MAG TPA: lipid-A-disaccharide synthase N-terminal domain-containing protein [Candidatus Brocadiia bacterium]|nr:lipid-A-disaccharide synthase N-terminal domain-containing protein [Candidatus Brocadiia bacterium]